MALPRQVHLEELIWGINQGQMLHCIISPGSSCLGDSIWWYPGIWCPGQLCWREVPTQNAPKIWSVPILCQDHDFCVILGVSFHISTVTYTVKFNFDLLLPHKFFYPSSLVYLSQNQEWGWLQINWWPVFSLSDVILDTLIATQLLMERPKIIEVSKDYLGLFRLRSLPKPTEATEVTVLANESLWPLCSSGGRGKAVYVCLWAL